MLYFIGNKVVVKLTLTIYMTKSWSRDQWLANLWYCLLKSLSLINLTVFICLKYLHLSGLIQCLHMMSWYTCIWNDWNSEMLQNSHAHYFTINGCQFWTEIMVFTLKKISRDHLCQPICPICYETDSVQMTYKIQQRTFNIT